MIKELKKSIKKLKEIKQIFVDKGDVGENKKKVNTIQRRIEQLEAKIKKLS